MESDAEAEAFRSKSKQQYKEGMNGHGTIPPPLSDEAQRETRAKELDEKAPPISSFLVDAMELAYRRAEGKIKPLKTPWGNFNEAMGGGLWPGLHVLIGSSGEGKSQLALQTALDAAQSGTPVLYIGLELGTSDLVMRLVALMMAKDAKGKKSPKWSDLCMGKSLPDLAAAEGYANALYELPLHLEVASAFGWQSPMLIERVRAMREKYPEPDGHGSGPILVVLDYLQVIAPERDLDGKPSRQDLRERIGQASYGARMVARDFGSVVVMISSTSRAAAKALYDPKNKPWDNDPRLYIDSGKESGEIEYSADSVLLLCRGRHIPEERRTETHIGITKLRMGTTSWQHLSFDGNNFTEDFDYDANNGND